MPDRRVLLLAGIAGTALLCTANGLDAQSIIERQLPRPPLDADEGGILKQPVDDDEEVPPVPKVLPVDAAESDGVPEDDESGAPVGKDKSAWMHTFAKKNTEKLRGRAGELFTQAKSLKRRRDAILAEVAENEALRANSVGEERDRYGRILEYLKMTKDKVAKEAIAVAQQMRDAEEIARYDRQQEVAEARAQAEAKAKAFQEEKKVAMEQAQKMRMKAEAEHQAVLEAEATRQRAEKKMQEEMVAEKTRHATEEKERQEKMDSISKTLAQTESQHKAEMELERVARNGFEQQARALESKLKQEQSLRVTVEKKADAAEKTVMDLQMQVDAITEKLESLKSDVAGEQRAKEVAVRRAQTVEKLHAGDTHIFFGQTLGGMNISSSMQMLQALSAASCDRNLMGVVSGASSKMRTKSAAYKQELQARFDSLLSLTVSVTSDELYREIGRTLVATSNAMLHHLDEAREIGEAIRDLLPDNVTRSMTSVIKKMTPITWRLKVEDIGLEKKSVSAACIEISHIMNNITQGMNVTKEMQVAASTDKMLPTLGAVIPDLNPAVTSLIHNMLGITQVELNNIDATMKGISENVVPLIHDKLHCHFETQAEPKPRRENFISRLFKRIMNRGGEREKRHPNV